MKPMLDVFGLNEAMVQWLNDLASQGIFITDSEFVIRGWNRWMEINSGRSSVDVIGQPLLEIFPEFIERGFDDVYLQAKHGHVQTLSQRFHRCLIRMPAPLGLSFSEMQQSARIAPLYSEGKIVGTVTVIDDVTERVSREAELKIAKDAAEDANRAKDEFLANLAHELRTPINNVMGWVHVLRLRNSDAALLNRALTGIEQNSMSQIELVEDLLDIARIVSGRLKIESNPVDLSSLVRSFTETSCQTAERKGIAFKTTIASDDVWVTGDVKRLKQVLSNIVSNAIKFTSTGGSVHVELRRNDFAEIRVADTGIGIKPEFLPRIFDRFQQAELRGRGQGLGLGLDIVKRLVESHGGTVSADSEGEGRGSVFTVKLPLRAPNQASLSNRGST